MLFQTKIINFTSWNNQRNKNNMWCHVMWCHVNQKISLQYVTPGNHCYLIEFWVTHLAPIVKSFLKSHLITSLWIIFNPKYLKPLLFFIVKSTFGTTLRQHLNIYLCNICYCEQHSQWVCYDTAGLGITCSFCLKWLLLVMVSRATRVDVWAGKDWSDIVQLPTKSRVILY